MEKEDWGSVFFPFVQIVHEVTRLGLKGFPVERVRFLDRSGCFQELTESMMLERPLPIPSNEHGWVSLSGDCSHAMAYVMGKETDPQFPSIS